jgi:hypothetical protein
MLGIAINPNSIEIINNRVFMLNNTTAVYPFEYLRECLEANRIRYYIIKLYLRQIMQNR